LGNNLDGLSDLIFRLTGFSACLLNKLNEIFNFVILALDLPEHVSDVFFVVIAFLSFVLELQLKSFQFKGKFLEFGSILGSNGVGVSLSLGVLGLFILELGSAFLDQFLVLSNFLFQVRNVLGNDVLLVGESLGGSGALDSLALGILGGLHNGGGDVLEAGGWA